MNTGIRRVCTELFCTLPTARSLGRTCYLAIPPVHNPRGFTWIRGTQAAVDDAEEMQAKAENAAREHERSKRSAGQSEHGAPCSSFAQGQGKLNTCMRVTTINSRNDASLVRKTALHPRALRSSPALTRQSRDLHASLAPETHHSPCLSPIFSAASFIDDVAGMPGGLLVLNLTAI